MKKRLLTTVNVLLGALSVTLVGCHTGKKAVKAEEPMMEKYGVPSEIRLMYGVPVEEEVFEPVPDSTAMDTLAAPKPIKPRPEERPIVKYGIPNDFR